MAILLHLEPMTTKELAARLEAIGGYLNDAAQSNTETGDLLRDAARRLRDSIETEQMLRRKLAERDSIPPPPETSR